MRSTRFLVAPVLVLACLGQQSARLQSEMARLRVSTALVVASDGIDEFVAWSPDSRFIAANIEGKWFKVDTQELQLHEAQWLGKRIGAVVGQTKMQPIGERELKSWIKQTRHGDLRVTGKSGLTAEIRRQGLSSSLFIAQGARGATTWKTDLESCEELSLSPDNAYLAYICEMNGVLVTDVKQALDHQGKFSPVQ